MSGFPEEDLHLTVLYDQECGMCNRLKQLLRTMPTYGTLEFLPLQDPSVPTRFPGIERYQPEKRLVAVDHQKKVFLGEGAWIMVLYMVQEYRELSLTLSTPRMRPLSRVVCNWISSHRQFLSGSFLMQRIQTRGL